MKRRDFVSGLVLAAGATACSESADKDVAEQGSRRDEVFEWKMVTSWPPKLPGLGLAADNLADRVTRASGGRLKIKVYAGGELVPALEVFGAVSSGAVEMGHGAAYYHKGKVDAAQYFTTVPFGMNANEVNAWIYYGGGLELWRELYEPHNLVPFPAGNTGTQMGGWFNRQINSVADLRGLKMRIPGLGGEVLRRAGVTTVLMQGSEIFTSLQTGAIDATEWVGPYNDMSLGLHKAAKYYYYPGWHEPGPTLECIVNKQAYESLPPDLQAIVEVASQAVNCDMQAEYNWGNARSLAELEKDPNIEFREFPKDVLELIKRLTKEVLDEFSARDPWAARIHKSYFDFLKMSANNQRISEQSYLQARNN